MTSFTQPGALPGNHSQIDLLLDHTEHSAKPAQQQAPLQLRPTVDGAMAEASSGLPANTSLQPSLPKPAEAREASLQKSRWTALNDVLDGVVTSIPIALAGVSLTYSSLPPEFLGMGVFATLLCLAVVHMSSAATGRPMAYSARLFEATTLSAILIHAHQIMPSWGLQATPQQIMAFLCMVCALAGLMCALLFLVRADRFTRLIPAPVYSGFAISISILLFISQSKTIYRLWQQGSPWLVLLSISLVSICAALLVRKFRPRWPSTAMAVATGALVGLLWLSLGSPVAMVMPDGQALMLPWQAADFSAFFSSSVSQKAWLSSAFYNGALLGIMIFINMTVANETLSQIDDRYASRWQLAGVALMAALGGMAGSAPVAASQQAALAAVRNQPMTGSKSFFMGIFCAMIAILGLLNWVALAAVAAAMLVDAYFMADRLAIKQGWAWLRGAQLQTSQKEDLALVALVASVAVLFNVVSAVFLGLLFGLLLFAMRNAKKPVRYIWTGAQLHSNCARARSEIAILASHGERIRVVELEGELFFGSVASLDKNLLASLEGAHCVILDWSRVRHVDSSIALALARWQRMATSQGVRITHAGLGLQPGNSVAFMQEHFSKAQLFLDVDRALEAAESVVIAHFGAQNAGNHQTTQFSDALHIFRGLSDEQMSKLNACMPQRLFKEGDSIFSEGDASDHMLIVLQGSAGVIVNDEAGREIRITSVRRGGVLGEIGFLDQAPRSAKVKAQQDVLAAILSRDVFNLLRLQEPLIVSQLLSNLTLDLSTRLRYTTKLAVSRTLHG
jgi:sulfate permease, SulP family